MSKIDKVKPWIKQKCNCRHPSCRYYGHSGASFNQGNGYDLEDINMVIQSPVMLDFIDRFVEYCYTDSGWRGTNNMAGISTLAHEARHIAAQARGNEFKDAIDLSYLEEVAALRCALIDNGLAMMDRERFVYPMPKV